MTIHSAVTERLTQQNIGYSVIQIPLTEDKKPVRNLEALLKNQGIDPLSVVRSIVFRTASDRYVLLAVAGGRRADWAALRQHLGERKCRMAEFEEVTAATGYVVGAVPPIALPESVLILVDNSVAAFDTVVIGSGVLGYAIRLKSADLLKLMHAADRGVFTSVEMPT